ncbi:acetyl-CoA carboxylase biotin carboxyl carrier protein [Paenibacillus sp. J2TS4]|uniref:acetyl-CoA carboxylase biotin carboxyl carrier protein n=1 Tax=Paenibacillus sp. J2TS4 TaxID=2807194 RepID=UPI001B024A8D|nr:acetyl-CoA carboxylase biotin carboxyl carrier protein [Paenibacillus sp. J2TS4]GIP32269.1 biotin carboxyl carrier protein of acetyl-CoA carboxylase [Paenibacillus sp. J2TS4]
MFKLSEIKELIKLVDQSSLQELEIQNEGSKLFIRKPSKSETVYVASQQPVIAAPQAPFAPSDAAVHPQPASEVSNQQDRSHLHTISSPMVGTFYKASSPDAPPYVSVGTAVRENTVVCIVEAMKLMNEIEAEVSGEIVEVLVENGQLVEFGQPLFLVKPV